MSSKTSSAVELSYRALYGKLFSSLIRLFGVNCFNEIEDAIQNAFLKSLRVWQGSGVPESKENWLFIVARNDVINQLKNKNRVGEASVWSVTGEIETEESDLRLQTILFLSSLKRVSAPAKVVFILKNIFGLSVREISENTLLSPEAVYKSINRTKSGVSLEFENKPRDFSLAAMGDAGITTVEEILYAVFNIGFDSFDKKNQSVVDEDLCLEAMALANLLYKSIPRDSTRNLLALFCFHLARVPAKVNKGKLVPFLKQDRAKWDKKLMALGFNYLQKPGKLHRFYIEALIASRYMTARSYDARHWEEIVELYELLAEYHHSPIVRLNLCYGLHKTQRTGEALKLLAEIEDMLPSGHIYFSLIKAEVLKAITPQESERIMTSVMQKMEQTIRKEYFYETLL